VDAVLEDWQHVAQYTQYEQRLKTVEDAGSNGLTGHSGWYVPTYVVQQHPELKTWAGLLKDWALFRTPKSAGKGALLGGAPSYITADLPLIRNLQLNLKIVYTGSEAAQITQVKQAYAQKKPILFYWYTPQWLNAELRLTEVMLPARTPGCDVPVESARCAYPSYDLRKVISTRFAQSGSPAVRVIRRFSWTAQDQDSVALMIAGKGMKPDDAARKWIKANGAKVKAWLG
jgi:glycine betaine/proline transport system substrate-binding protein